MNSVSNTTTHNYIHVSLSMINKTKLLLICILSSPRYFYKLICWFIILINSYRHSRISVDSIPDLDLSTSPESSTSASTESDLGEDIESFVWRGLTFQSIEYIISLCKSKPCCVSVCFTNILLSFKCGMDSFTFFNSQNFKMTILYDGQIAQRLFFNIFTSLHNTQHTIVYLFFFGIHSILTYSYINKL